MKIQIEGANENNLQNINVEFKDGLTVVTGISGSGKSSLVFSTLYHEARRRFSEIYTRGSKPRLVPAKVHRISGLGPTIAIEQNVLNRNPLSTVASASGLHPFLRIFYINYGQRRCSNCESDIRVYSEDEIIDLISQLLKRNSIKLFAQLVKGVKGSHRSLLQNLETEFGRKALLVDGQWYNAENLSPDKPHDIEVKIRTIEQPLTSGEIRKELQNIAALGVNAIKITLETPDQNSLVLPFTYICPTCNQWIKEVKASIFNTTCPFCNRKGCDRCQGTGLHPEALSITWKGNNLLDLLKLSITEVNDLFKDPKTPSSAERLIFEIQRRLEALIIVGLGYITLNRSSPTLSRGESQRVRLAVALVSRLEDMVHVLDEPTIGLSIIDVTKLLPAFKQLKGPVIFVEHDRIAAASADQAVDLGPGAGIKGGKVVFSGSLTSLWKSDGYTGKFFSLQSKPIIPKHRSPPTQFLKIIEATQHNLQRINVSIPIERLTVITGPSGSGKSTFVEEVLYASLKKNKPIGCKEIKGRKLKPILVDQSPIGKNPRSNPATYTNLASVIREVFANVTKLSSSHFSFNREEGWCKNCKGMGAIEVKLRFLPSTWIICEVCEGRRFSDEVLQAKVKVNNHSFSIADFYEFSVDEAFEWFLEEKKVALTTDRSAAKRILQALREVGLGYLPLGQSSPTLSGGEAQRVKLAKYLGQKSLKDQLIILDEPSTGLHSHDISCLLSVLNKLVRTGATIVVVEHNSDFIRAADWIIDLGPGAGPEGGQLIYNGNSVELLNRSESLTTQGLIYEKSVAPKLLESLPYKKSDVIKVNNASANNLKNITVEFPKNGLTVVTGVSGSGKSSLVNDVLKAEAERRYLETLSLYERQGLSEGPEAPVKSISGLGVTISIDPRRISRWFNYRSTVGLITEISHHLTILISNFGEYRCNECSVSCLRQPKEWICPKCKKLYLIPEPKFFSPSNYASACLKCQGIGTLQIPKPEKLIVNPEKALCKGAMYSPGFFPKGYLCKRYNGGYYVIQALANRFQFDPMATSWNEMSTEAQNAFLFGLKEPLEVTFESRSKKIGNYTRTIEFRGFYGWIGDWDVGGTYSSSEMCPACNGTRLRPEYLVITLGSYNIHELNEMPFYQLLKVIKTHSFPDIHTHIAQYSLDMIIHRLEFLNQVGLGYINASRVIMTLSAGEAQRIRLAGLLGSNLTSLTILADEPTRGLHPSEINGLLKAIDSLRENNTIIIVEHDPQVIKEADYIIDLGPGPGELGGEIVAQGSVTEVSESNSITGMWLGKRRHFKRPKKHKTPRTPQGWLKLFGASQNNLKGNPLEIPLGTLVSVCGVSGSGKSTLMIDTLGRILAPRKQTTSVAYEPIEPGTYTSIEGAPSRTLVIDQSKQEVSTPLTYLNLRKPLISLYAESDDAKAAELDEKSLFQQCTSCKGRGRIRMDMGFLPDVYSRCDICQGTGLTAETWMVRLHGYTLPELYDLTLDEIYDLFKYEEKIFRPLKAVKEVGLGYLVLQQPRIHLSGGECQRLKIAKELCRKKSKTSTLYILDEPTVGLHLQDVSQLLKILHRLVDEGNTVVVIEHHPHVLAASDWIIEIGPVGGPDGGYIVANGTPAQVAKGSTPTAQYLNSVLEGHA